MAKRSKNNNDTTVRVFFDALNDRLNEQSNGFPYSIFLHQIWLIELLIRPNYIMDP